MKAIAFVSLRRILSEFVRTSSYEGTSNLKAIRFTSLSRNSGRIVGEPLWCVQDLRGRDLTFLPWPPAGYLDL